MDIFSAFEIKERTSANRTVMAPIVMTFAKSNGAITSSLRDFYIARARVCFIVLGAAYVHEDGRGFSHFEAGLEVRGRANI